MNTITRTALVLAGFFIVEASASQERTYKDTAEVLDVVPIVSHHRVATPERECATQHRRDIPHTDRRDRRSGSSALLGGLIGGAIGHQFGRGNGKKAMTVAGAVVGASIAQSSGHRSAYRPIDAGQMNCRTRQRISEEERIEGYRVTYEYLGEQFTQVMDRHPGDQIEIEVQLTPQIVPAYPQ